MSLPVVHAVVCYLRRETETLFMDYTSFDHPLHKGKFSPPGGKLEEVEGKETAATREILEETGIIINKMTYRGEVTFLNEQRTFNGKPAKYNFRVYFYDSSDFNDTNARATEGALAWIQNDKVCDIPMHEGDKIIWDWLRKYKEIRAEIIHVGDKLTESSLLSFKEL